MNVVFPALGQAGRLGNQLWQIASTIGIAASAGGRPVLPEDWDYRPFFSIPDELFGPQDGMDAATVPQHLDHRARVYLQDYGLWADVTDEIREYFYPSGRALAVLSEDRYLPYFSLERPVLSVQVRRGDNVPGADPSTPDKHLYHAERPLRYYVEGMLALEPYESIAIFSDDPAWCRDHLPAEYYSEGATRPKEHERAYRLSKPDDWVDLFMMTSADKHVISNSTYGFWGAFLSKDESPIYPWPWVGPRLGYVDASLMFPPSWTRLDHG